MGNKVLFDAGTGAQAALTSAFQSVASEIQATVLGILPIALGVLGLTVAIIFGVRFFKRVMNRA